MNICGLTDSIATLHAKVQECPRCHTTSRIAHGLCLGCLLRTGADEEEDLEIAEFDAALSAVVATDTNWRLGNYEILEEIGRGGMGVIYRARQRHSRRIVALKRILSYHADSRETLTRFRREAEAAASLDHPNILPIYEVGESEDGVPYFSMKYAPGGSLQEVGLALRYQPREVVRLMAKVTRAVQYAHRQGILHRDLKPGNILLDGRGEPLVSDFGLAKWLDTTSDLTRTLTIFGTPGYIAPEQADGPAASLKPSADIYSLGAILFDLLAGRPPFLGEHALAVIRQAAEKPAPKLRSLIRPLDRDLETICAKCLEREPAARYRSAGDLAEDLERWLEGRPIMARPVLIPAQAWRWARRNPKLAGSIAACVILAGAGVTEWASSSRFQALVRQAETERHSVAIAPIEDLDGLSKKSDSAREVTATLSEELLATNGIHLQALTAAATETDLWSADEWKRIGQSAGARLLIAGTVRQRLGKKHLALHLIESSSGAVVASWLQDVESLSELNSEVVRKVSHWLAKDRADHPTAATSENRFEDGGTQNVQARSYYERGKEFFFRYNLPDQARAIDSLRKAIELDSNYAKAYAMLANACQLRALSDPDPRWLEEAQTSAESALRIAPLLPDAHRARGGLLQGRGQLRDALESYLNAYELEPGNARAAATVGTTWDALGRPDLAVRWIERASALDTRPVYADNLGDALTALGEYEQAEEAYHTAAIFRPDLPVGTLGLARLALFRGDAATGRALCLEARAKYLGDPQPLMMAGLIEFFAHDFVAAERIYTEASRLDRAGGIEFAGSVRFLSALGFIEKTSGRTEKGRLLLQEAIALDETDLRAAPQNPKRLYSRAANEAALEQSASALASLQQAVDAGWVDYRSLELDPRFDNLRRTNAFQEILDRLKTKIQAMERSMPHRGWPHTAIRKNKNDNSTSHLAPLAIMQSGGLNGSRPSCAIQRGRAAGLIPSACDLRAGGPDFVQRLV